jgi:DNA primase
MKYTAAFLQEIRFRNDIEDVISRYMPLKSAGSVSKACCPFHNDKTPSFTVYKDTKSFYCFGCMFF